MTTPVTGLLLLNLGTPEAPTAAAVRPYLREFLSDPRVINIPGPLRWFLVNCIIVPFRSPKSAHAYQSIWTPEGSPLLTATQKLAAKVRARLSDAPSSSPAVQVQVAMRYGTPSIPQALEALKKAGAERIVVFPLYPQYSSATSASSMERVVEVAKQEWNMPTLSFVPPFYDHPAFIDAVYAAGIDAYRSFQPDHVLFSYHGLPENHLEQCDETGTHCLRKIDCCEQITAVNSFCYRAHCMATTRALVQRFDLVDGRHSTSFQSRLGRQEWVKPYTEETLHRLAKQGVKRLAVLCPAFVADCLETLEEIGMRAKEDFVAAGGEDLALIPCVNDHDVWVDGVIRLVAENTGWLGALPTAAKLQSPAA